MVAASRDTIKSCRQFCPRTVEEMTVAAARDLEPMDKNLLTEIGAQKGSSDPYVEVKFDTRYWYTEVVNDNLFPSWEESFTFDLIHGEMLKGVIKLHVYDYDGVMSRADDLGEAKVHE